jgi:pimeloyl-ACP methyl ester carboxylesterase
VQQQANMKISDLNIEECAKKCEVPVLFLHGQNDNFIVPQHSQTNF